ncbi:hypothetical protein RRG08_039660 [Elysia crispata]|uniref:Uncharacterized protein n=1 Tax=Elysia crispata TaxID=231223 RepID=A0AAE1CVL5_9GAST|nr:hypothetical protein RRG08_039660 [Elysia crispata]
MCLLKTKIMDLPHAIVTKLQTIMQQERAFYNQLNLKDLSQAEFEHYTSVREKCVQYLKVPHIYFGTQADTFATAVAILDVFLWKVKRVTGSTCQVHPPWPVLAVSRRYSVVTNLDLR